VVLADRGRGLVQVVAADIADAGVEALQKDRFEQGEKKFGYAGLCTNEG
jgi:hypothetical protein